MSSLHFKTHGHCHGPATNSQQTAVHLKTAARGSLPPACPLVSPRLPHLMSGAAATSVHGKSGPAPTPACAMYTASAAPDTQPPALQQPNAASDLAPEQCATHNEPVPQVDTQCLTVNPDSFAAPSSQQSQVVIDLTAGSPAASPASALAHIQHDPVFDPQLAQAPTPTYSTDLAALQQAAQLLQQGQLVAMPTETVYGLAADALQPAAVRRIYAAKQRPADNPLIVHVSSIDMLQRLYPPGWSIPDVYVPVLAAHWPGPLTVLLPRSPLVHDEVVCGQPTMAVRLPAHPVARALIALAGTPLAAPSANSSGRPSPTLAAHVVGDLGGRVPLVVDGGLCQCGVESTVLDGLRTPPVVLRPGGVTVEQLSQFPSMAGLQVYRKHFVDAALEAAPTTPGMKYRHYSPRAAVTLLDLGQAAQDPANVGAVREAAQQQVVGLVGATGNRLTQGVVTSGRPQAVVRVGVLRTSRGRGCQPGLVAAGVAEAQYDLGQLKETVQVEVVEYVLGDLADPATVARELFVALRLMDERAVGEIVVEGVVEVHEGLAVMNRLRKAASQTVMLQV